jgi:hypothetical protein
MDLFKGQVAFESAQFQSGDFAEELLMEMQRLRDVGDFSQAAMKKCKVSALTKLYTDIDVQFVVSDKISNNAYFIIPSMDKNHPFLKQMGLEGYGESGITLQSIRESAMKSKDAGVDLRTGRVKGYFKQVKVTIAIAHNLFTNKEYKTENICGIYAHELGHAFTYFEYFGNIVRRSILVDQASKTVMDPAFNSESKLKLLKEVEKQLGTEDLGLEKTINLPAEKAKLKVETVLITDDLFNHTRTESSTPYYDARNIEQLADQFCVIHGMGKWQAEALAVIYKHYRDASVISATEFLIVEFIKLSLVLFLTFTNPILILLYGLTFIPMPLWYDRPKERIEYLKRQMIGHLKLVKDPMVKEKLVEDIRALDMMLEEFSNRFTLFEVYLNYLNPWGRRMYKEEKFRKLIEEALNNDLFLKAAEFEVAK